jgi:NADH-quinone oxidoreductase subunit L
MLGYLGLVPLFPLLGFLILVGSQGNLPRKLVPWVGVGSVGLAAILAGAIGYEFLTGPVVTYKLPLWSWAKVGDFSANFGLYLDHLSLNMLWVVTGVGFLIHLYSIGYMGEDPGYARFFAYMNLFVAAMLVLVLADNLVFLYLGWEGVGLCSYLLIGFWYEDPANGAAARKAFLMTRVGDTAFALGLFLLFSTLGSLDIQTLSQRAVANWPPGSQLPVLASALLLGGAVGKSAQLPLQTWLPDAMAGPTPISALIHAATMVTAGVYLIARNHALFQLAPPVMHVVAVIGAATLLMAGCSALVQRDIKRILAYSTISQLGYMFLALGVGAFGAAIFHLTTHAFFKALLFLAAGSVLHCYNDEHDIYQMGGLRHRLPITFWSFVVGAAALTALPFTSGYFSKHEILAAVHAAPGDGLWLWAAGVTGAMLTGLYSFRLIFVAFFGPPNLRATEHLGFAMAAPLVVLSLGAIFGGLFPMPLASVLPAATRPEFEPGVEILTEAAPLVGVGLAVGYFLTRAWSADNLAKTDWGSAFHRLWFNGWGLDWLYARLLVDPFTWFAEANKGDVVDDAYTGVASASKAANKLLAATQNGQLRRYAVGVAGGAVLVLALGILL